MMSTKGGGIRHAREKEEDSEEKQSQEESRRGREGGGEDVSHSYAVFMH